MIIPPSPLSCQYVDSLSLSSCVSPVELLTWGGGEVGEEPNHMTAGKPGPPHISHYSLQIRMELQNDAVRKRANN